MHFHEFLVEPAAHQQPKNTLEGLSTTDAERRVPGTNHSIAEIVAHMVFWQEWFYKRCIGDPVPPAAAAADGWPAVAPDSWPDLRTRFVDLLPKLSQLAQEKETTKPLTPAIEFPPLARYTIGDALVHVATHNSHHLGEIVILRQVLGTWPPPAGSWTW